ncbi:right-handed parallel beta-helix repeat-containing protein [Burkholderia diffusa]|uniref:right-handed parallel beta-helix repeat-containing protein n=1 Tax=Burkholderia diffusa TaxID=488732 RepID=UPI000ACF2086|nr:right-handed parallel beta-helix repeat-containing protein [Burkholderia diffusa]
MRIAVKLKSMVAIIVCGAALWHVSTSAATYYVNASTGNDANNGTSMATPWQTFSRINGGTFNPGDQILFRRGDTFPGQMVIPSSGTLGNPIIFSAYKDPSSTATALPVLSGATDGTMAVSATILVQDKDNLEFNNLRIKNNNYAASLSGTNNVFGILVKGTGLRDLSYYRINNSTVSLVGPYQWNSSFDLALTAGISFQNTSTQHVIKDIVVDSNKLNNNGRFGVLVIDQSSTGSAYNPNQPILGIQDVSFTNNVCNNNGGSCLMGRRVKNLLILGNTITNSGAAKPVNTTASIQMINRGSGAWFSGCYHVAVQNNYVAGSYGPGDSSNIHVDGSNNDVVIQYNKYFGDSGAGFELLGGNHHVIYRFNYSANDGMRAGAGIFTISNYVPPPMGGAAVASDDVWIYNNTFTSNLSAPTSLAMGINATNIHFYNNIFADFGTSTIAAPSFPAGYATSTMSWSNNLFYGAQSGASAYDGAAILKNPNFVSTAASAFSANSIFVNNFKLLTSSPALGVAYMGFSQPQFQAAGTGIFANISAAATQGFFGEALPASWNVGPYQSAGQ